MLKCKYDKFLKIDSGINSVLAFRILGNCPLNLYKCMPIYLLKDPSTFTFELSDVLAHKRNSTLF